MPHYDSPLDGISVATPCSQDWDSMTGDNRVRFCHQCKLNVYNLSGMKREEAEALVQQSEGRLCIQFLQRADGTIITRDCPVALHQKRFKTMRRGIAATITLVTLVGAFTAVAHAGELLPKCDDQQRPNPDIVEIKGEMVAPDVQKNTPPPAQKDPYIRGRMLAPHSPPDTSPPPQKP